MAKFELYTPNGNRFGTLTWQSNEPIKFDADENARERDQHDLELASGIINRSSGGQIFYDHHERGFSRVYAKSVRIGAKVEPRVLAGILYRFSRVKLKAQAV